MWLYLGPSCPNRPFSEELSVAEINTWIYKVLDHGANPNLGAGPAPLQEGVDSTRFSLHGPILVAYTFLSFHHAHGLVQGLGGAHRELRGTKLHEDAVRREASCALNEKVQAQKERRQAQSTTRRAAKEGVLS
jgi:hypothetical protein